MIGLTRVHSWRSLAEIDLPWAWLGTLCNRPMGHFYILAPFLRSLILLLHSSPPPCHLSQRSKITLESSTEITILRIYHTPIRSLKEYYICISVLISCLLAEGLSIGLLAESGHRSMKFTRPSCCCHLFPRLILIHRVADS